jgi:hypothetical protein
MKKILIAVAVVAVLFLLLANLRATRAEEYESTTVPQAHPKAPEKCPSGSPEQSLHCEGCCHPEHEKGCNCLMNYPCGKEYEQTAYCTPTQL